MARTAELVTRELKLADFRGREPHPVDHPSRDNILVNPKLRNIKRVDYIFGIQPDMNRPVNRDLQNRRSKIVLRVGIVRIVPEHVVVGNKTGLSLAEFIVRARVLKRKAELVSRNSYLKGIG